MPIQSLMIMLLLTVIFPLMILTSNTEVFFIVLSIVLLFSSLKSLYELFFTGSSLMDDMDDESEQEELEEFLGLDVKKLEAGFRLVKNLLILLYFTYCSFYIHNLFIKIFIFAIALYWIYDIILSMQTKDNKISEFGLFNSIFLSIINISTISIVIITAFSKFMG